MPIEPQRPQVNLCTRCDRWVPVDELQAVQSGSGGRTLVCQSCYDRCPPCQSCNQPALRRWRIATSEADRRSVCRDCLGTLAGDPRTGSPRSCYGCGYFLSNEVETFRIVGSGEYCTWCLRELGNYDSRTTCTSCERLIRDDHITSSPNTGEVMCEPCIAQTGVFCESDTFERNPFQRFVGVEMEMVSRRDRNHIREISEVIRRYGRIKGDGSIRPTTTHPHGHEIVFYPLNGDRLFNVITQACNDLRGVARANDSCGLHIHIDARDFRQSERLNIWRGFSALETVFLGMCSRSRVDNTYCERVGGRYRPGTGRYSTLNYRSLDRHGTLEFRLHQGSCNAHRITSWITTLLNFMETFRHINLDETEWRRVSRLTQREKVIFLFQQAAMPMSVRKYMVRRLRRFHRWNLNRPVQRSMAV